MKSIGICGIVLAVVCGTVCGQENRSRKEKLLTDFPQLSFKRDWPWWRGPTRNGISLSTTAPTKFNSAEGFAWKTPIAGRGHSSPIVVGEHLFLTTANEAEQTQSVLAFERSSGKLLWEKELSRGGFPERNHPKNTAATPTIACDGQRIFVLFFHHEAIEATALDFTGKVQWQREVGPFNPRRYEYGYAPCPLLYGDTVIISSEYDGQSFLAALDSTSGKEVWRQKRPNNISFSSPVVGHVAGRDQLLLSGNDRVAAWDPATGKELWSVAGTTAATCGTLVWEGDTVFASGGYPKAETLAITADGSGKVLWRNNQKCYEQSLLVHEGYAYAFTDGGVLYCWRGSDGREMWKERLRGPVSASPVLAGGYIYWANELGTYYVFKPNPERLEMVAENKVGSEAFASPAIAAGAIYLRGAETVNGQRQEFLICFGPEK